MIPTIGGIVKREPTRAAPLHEYFFFFLLFSSETATIYTQTRYVVIVLEVCAGPIRLGRC